MHISRTSTMRRRVAAASPTPVAGTRLIALLLLGLVTAGGFPPSPVAAGTDMVVIDEFDDGVVDTIWTSIGGASLVETDGVLIAHRTPGVVGPIGVRFVNPFASDAPLSGPDGRRLSRVVFTASCTSPLVVSQLGSNGARVDSTTVDPAAGVITHCDRDAFGNIRCVNGVSFDPAAGDSITIEERRTYSLIPPTCKGEKCDYGFDCCPVLFVGKWRLGVKDQTGGGNPFERTTSIRYDGVAFTTEADSVVLRRFELHTGPDDPTGPTPWSVSPNDIHVSGGELVTIHGAGFLTLGRATLTFDGLPVPLTVVDDGTMTFVSPPSPAPSALVNLVVTSEDGSIESILDEELRYYVTAEPLVINRDPVPAAVLGAQYFASLTVDSPGGGGAVFEVISGNPPSGITLAPDGTLSGVGDVEGQVAFHVAVTDAAGQQDIRLVWMDVQPAVSVPAPDEGDALALRATSPVRGAAGIWFYLPSPTEIRLDVVDVSGRLVRTLADRRFDAGRQAVSWDARDAEGRLAAPGTYFLHLRVGERRISTRTIVLP